MIGLFFWGLGLIAIGGYARVNLAELPLVKQIADLLAIAGLAVFGYASVLVAMARSAYR